MNTYIFRGAPASGKGTITREFIKTLTGKVAYLELDNFRWGFHLYNRKVEDVTEEEHMFAYRNFLSILENYCKNGNYTLVIEGLFSWEEKGPHGNMNEVLDILNKYNCDHKNIFLKGDYDTLWKRNEGREHVVPESEFKELFDYVGNENPQKEIVLDVSTKTIEETLKEMSEKL